MSLICYTPKKFSAQHRQVIEQANAICAEYAEDGLSLTLRQLYYQFVARDLFPASRRWRWNGARWTHDPDGTINADPNYKWLGDICNDARMAGEIDWDFLVDRTRNLAEQPHWRTPDHLIRTAAEQYRIDLWHNQHRRVEVWIEKDAAIGVIEQVCRDNGVPFFSCRGYTSVSEMWNASQRIGGHLRRGEQVTILHIGDHDPSGLDMTDDIDKRLRRFITKDWMSDHAVRGTGPGGARTVGDIFASMRDHLGITSGRPWRVKRIALNYDQVLQYNPPPNPAKSTDSRFLAYTGATGLDESWELDALSPNVLRALIQTEITALRDPDVWGKDNLTMETGRQLLREVGRAWPAIRAQYTPDHLRGIDTGTDDTEDDDTEDGTR